MEIQNTSDFEDMVYPEIPRTPFPSMQSANTNTNTGNAGLIYPNPSPSSSASSSSSSKCHPLPHKLPSSLPPPQIKQGYESAWQGRAAQMPEPLEIRPPPLGSSKGQAFSSIFCMDTQLWAGLECGLRVWSIHDATNTTSTSRSNGNVDIRDEDTAPFRASVWMSPILCLFPDAANNIVWSGHMDGKVGVWHSISNNDKFDAIFTWQAHEAAPVMSMAVTSYGELWTGSECGALKAWPWEAIRRSLSLAPRERHIAVLSIERSYIDLRSRVTSLGTCIFADADVRFLLPDHSTKRVWSGGYFCLAIWDARTRNVLKILVTNAEAEFHSKDISVTRDYPLEDEVKINYAEVSKKEKTQGALRFFQCSKSVFMEAAVAVRRARVESQVEDDTKKIEALAASANQMIWTGYTNGQLVQWDCHGNRIQEFMHASVAIKCLRAFGTRIWIGYADGRVNVLEQDGKLLGGWVAHDSFVKDMAVGGGYVFTVAGHGGIRGWTMISPSPLDSRFRLALMEKSLSYIMKDHFKILVGTWNVNQEKATYDSLISWLGSPASEASIVVIGLQEMDMRAGFLAMAAAKERVGIEGSSNGQWWLNTIGKILDEGISFQRAGSRQLAGLLVCVWVRKDLEPYVGDVDAGALPCGFGRKIGNKGAVALKMRIFRRTLCIINCHFSAHLDAIARRNADFEYVYQNMTFRRTTTGINFIAPRVSFAVQRLKGINACQVPDLEGDETDKDLPSLLEVMPELDEADMVIWLGDFNYRLNNISYDEAISYIANKQFDTLLERDQLRQEMKAGRVFQGMREADIKFPPTYKFDKGQVGWKGSNSSEKKRVPAWCDRILFRDSSNGISTECNLASPIVSSVEWYDACMDITHSDHKPVRCMFKVDILRIDEYRRRMEYGNLITSNEQIKRLLEESKEIPDTVVSTNNIVLQEGDSSVLRITNTCVKNKAVFEILCAGEAIVNNGQSYNSFLRSSSVRGCFGFPRWLQVLPACGIIGPGETIEICVHHKDFITEEEHVDGRPHNSWCEDQRDKVSVLLVRVRGNGSYKTKEHRICVCHGMLSRVQLPLEEKDEKTQTNTLQRSNFHPSDLSTNHVPDLRFTSSDLCTTSETI